MITTQTWADDCTPWAGKDPRPASLWDHCKEVGYIAGQVAQLRDSRLAEKEAAMLILQVFPSVRGLTVDQVDQQYVAPVYQSTKSWLDTCEAFQAACKAGN